MAMRWRASKKERERERDNKHSGQKTKTQRSAEKGAISEGVLFKTTMMKVVKEIMGGNHKEGKKGYIFQ